MNRNLAGSGVLVMALLTGAGRTASAQSTPICRTASEWLEHVTDDQYAVQPRGR